MYVVLTPLRGGLGRTLYRTANPTKGTIHAATISPVPEQPTRCIAPLEVVLVGLDNVLETTDGGNEVVTVEGSETDWKDNVTADT